MCNNRIEKDNQNVDVKRQETKISIKNSKNLYDNLNSKNLYDNLSSNTLFEFENKKQHSNKIVNKFLTKKAILKRLYIN